MCICISIIHPMHTAATVAITVAIIRRTLLEICSLNIKIGKGTYFVLGCTSTFIPATSLKKISLTGTS